MHKQQHYQSATYTARSSVGYLLKRSHALLRDVSEPALAARGFTFIQYIILVWIRDGIAVNPKDICFEYRHNSGALTRVIDQLADRGLLERVRGVEDRRKVDLRLTSAGRKAVESLIPFMVDTLNTALGDFSGSEVRELVRLLHKFNANLLPALGSTSGARASVTGE